MNTDASWRLGLLGAMYGIGLALGMLILGAGFAAKLRTLDIATLPELLGKRFCCPWLKRSASLLACVCLGGILMAQAIGLKKFLLSLGFTHNLIFLAAWGSVVLYTTCGGLLAVIWTDTLQAVVMIGMLVITFCFTLLPHWSEITAQASSMGLTFDGMNLASFLFPLCYIFVTQDMAQRCFAAKSPRDATIGCLGTALALLVVTIIPTACGILGKAMDLSPTHGAIFMQVVRSQSSTFVFVIAASAVLLAIISTASAVLLALSSNIVEDLAPKKGSGKVITSLLGLLAMCGAYFGDDILFWLVTCNEMAVGAVFIPILFAVFSREKTLPKEAGWGAFIFGSFGTLLSTQCQESVLAPFLPFTLSILGYVLGRVVALRKCDRSAQRA